MRRRGLLPALVAFALTCAFVVQGPGWAQTSYMALSKAMSHGTAQIDDWHWETHDVAYSEGHFYSVKPPGLVVATYPLYAGLHAVGAEGVAHDMRVRAQSDGGARWSAKALPIENYGYNEATAYASREAILDEAPITWVLRLLGVLLPALVMLVLVARLAERVAPGTGTATATALGVGTLVLPFSTLYFSHMLSAALGFGAFAVLWRERERDPSARTLLLAGLLAGLAIVCEYPLGLLALVLGGYAVSRRVPVPDRARRALAYGGGLAAGVAPLLAYHWWAFGDPLHMSYENAVAVTGATGHDVLGLNDDGFFGITAPRLGDAWKLLLGGRGLLTLAPVLVLALAGLVAHHRSGRHRAEVRTIFAIVLVYIIYNAGYWQPYGGGSPGPRFLFPILPFLGIGLAVAWRRWPAPTLALSVAGATTMIAATMTYPMIGADDAGEWVRRMFSLGLFQHSVLDLTGVAHGVVAILPFAIGAAVTLGLGARTLGRAGLAAGARWAPMAVVAWWLCLVVVMDPTGSALLLFAAAGLFGLLAVALVVPRHWGFMEATYPRTSAAGSE